MSEPVDDAGTDLDIAAVVEQTEEYLLGGPRRFTRLQVCEQAGMSLDDARGIWRALGFPTTSDDDVVFTAADVDALRAVSEIVATGAIDVGDVTTIARLMGQTFYRLASTEGQFLLNRVLEHVEVVGSEQNAIDLVQRLTPAVAHIQEFVWRRQMTAFLWRLATRVTDDADSGSERVLSVGFADMEGFTSRTRSASEQQLRDLLEDFERVSTDVVTQYGGHVVKAIGDEVLFAAPRPAAAAQIALALRDAAGQSGSLPDLRIGLATGPVVMRMGDIFGSTVNIASRLTSLCRPGWVLVDRGMAEALEGDGRFDLKSRRPESVRGYHHLHAWRLRRPGESKRPRHH
jgi:adenylate cyclase